MENQFETNDSYQTYTTTNSVEDPGKTNSVLALIMGILSIILCCCSVIGIIPGILGIVFSRKAKNKGEIGGMATAGLVCSIIGIVFGVLATIVYVIYGALVFSIVSAWDQAGILDQIQYMDQSEIQQLMIEYMQ